ncbi:Na(+)/citrate cotransporter-like [Engraulis encrasicolus]|uniref:Na(+)/citrate cotransporter-like n=1 Tax=Engraulis encrasicolus TaxID=184585 RepID=UPI002FD66E14
MMAAKFKQILRAFWQTKNGFILFLTPIVFLPLPIVIGSKEAGCAYIIALMAVYWCTEVLPLAVTALLPVILLPLFGIMTSKDVCMQYLQDTNMLFVGGLLVAVAVEHWNLHKRIALRVLLLVGVRPALLMLGFMGVTAFLSMWISNTATTAMMVPIVQAVLEQLNQQGAPQQGAEERSTTLPETTDKPNEKEADGVVLMNGMSLEDSRDELQRPDEDEEDEKERMRMCKGLTLCVCYAASIGGTATLTGTGPNLVLSGQMSQLFPNNGDVINFASWFGFAFPNMLLMLVFAWIWLQFVFLGFNFRKTWGCGTEKSEKEVAAYNVIRSEHQRLGPMSFGEISVLVLFTLLVVLWFTREPGFIDGWATHLFNSQKEFVTDATVAVFVATLLFVLPSQPPFCGRSQIPQGSREPTPALLTWKVAQSKMPWSIVLLLGGGFALAKGSEDSGLSGWLGEQMTPLQSIPPWAIAIILCLLIATFTECTSNVATATLFLPILASMCQSIRLNPLYVMIPCTLSASFAFMLPVATPPNAIVFSYGYLRVSDMARTGFVMNIIGILCITLAINSWGRAIFSLDTFPSWANATGV